MKYEQYLSILTLASTIIAFVTAIFIWLRSRREALDLHERESRLPDATRYEDLRRKVVDHQAIYDNLRNELLSAREEIGKGQAIRSEYEHLTNRIDSLRSELVNVEQDTAKRKLESELDYGKAIQELQSKLNLLQQQLQREEAKLAFELDSRKRDFATQLAEAERNCAKKKNDFEAELEYQLLGKRNELAELENELNFRKIGLNKAIEQHKLELESKLQSLKIEIQQQENLVKQEREKHLWATEKDASIALAKIQKDLELQKLAAEQQLEALRAKNEHLNNRVQELQQLHDEILEEINSNEAIKKQLDLEITSLRSEKEQLEKAIPTLKEVWEQLLTATGGGNEIERTAELWKPSLDVFPSSKTISEEESLANVERYLFDLGLAFDRRLVYAFHTSLKVTDSSPLVVLAGISGTGKSELPRRYAEAIGMSFLPMPVQPRWDSPQDMFGFFNYLENRFRATELGRALVQMDPYATEKGRGWPAELPNEYQPLSDQLLLVLLDEMNLARVEYYFSDFLSKLETRRGVNLNDPTSRRKAELTFEIGRTGLGNPTMNVFVGSNVLFVGTMNEDETTQTLSDKVIDRSNLIRFGCPTKLRLQEKAQSSMKAKPQRLTYKNWLKWQVDAAMNSHDLARTDEVIQRMNEAMSKVRRPFAHRTSNAIRAYVANYPLINDSSFQNAVADQIEQKLLPKFRGLDPTEREVGEALDLIRSIIDETEDSPLLAALKRSCEGHQFLWNGVDRSQRPTE